MNKKAQPNFNYEIDLEKNNGIIAGVDEVGRGCIAGPIVACAVVFQDYEKIKKKLKGVTDSKKLTAKKREELDLVIRKHAADFAIGMSTVEEIDTIGIGAANILAFKRALDSLKRCDYALIDGRKFRGFEYRYLCLEKGELKSLSIAAASIVAKVFRDKLMGDIHPECPEYDFLSNKGYGGKSHYQALEKLGPSTHHRKTFLRKFEEHKSQSSLF